MSYQMMQRSWESGTEGPGPEIEMIGGGFLSRPRTCMGCSAWEWVSPLEEELFHADRRTVGQTDMSKLIVAFRNFTSAPKTEEGSPSREWASSFLYLCRDTIGPGVLHVTTVGIRNF